MAAKLHGPKTFQTGDTPEKLLDTWLKARTTIQAKRRSWCSMRAQDL